MEAIRHFKKPLIAKDLKKFLGMINFYRPFIPRAADNQHILQTLIQGNKKNDKTAILWSTEADYAFDACKNELANATLLNYMAPNSQVTLTTDASDEAMGAVLHQIVNGQTQPRQKFRNFHRP